MPDRADIENIYPLTPLQEGLLFHAQYEPESAVYWNQYACVIDGALDLPAFRLAWEQVTRRHEALRTCFAWKHRETPLQIVLKETAVPWTTEDWSDRSPDQQRDALDRFLEHDRRHVPELAKGPLMRLAVARLGKHRTQFIWSQHHIILDGWSGPLVLKEVFTRYASLATDRPANLTPASPFSKYVQWLKRQDLEDAGSFWREALRGCTSPTPLGYGWKPSRHHAICATQPQADLTLSWQHTDACQRFAAANGFTLSTVVQGAWAILLSRYGRTEDVMFGATVSGRPPELDGVESMVGLFINTLPVRVVLPLEASVRSLLDRVQEAHLGIAQHAHASLVQVKNWSQVPGNLPLFESLVVYENFPAAEEVTAAADGLSIRNVRAIESTHYTLTLEVHPGEELYLRLTYDRDRFSATQAERMVGHLASILTHMVADAGQSAHAVPMLTREEVRQEREAVRRNRAPYPDGYTLCELIDEAAEQYAGRRAATCGQESVDYNRLREQVSAVADALVACGVRRGAHVAVYMERSMEMLYAVLGVMKTGAAYVPLDRAYPPRRIEAILEETDPPVILTDRRTEPHLPRHGATVIRMDALPRDAADLATPPIAARDTPSPEDAAYVIFTSGSTGRPKGVRVPHRAVVNFLTGMRHTPGMAEDDVLLAVTPLTFDISVLELLLPLLAGGEVVIADRETCADGQRLLQLLEASGATIMQATPSTWRLLLQAGWPGTPRLKALCGGEALPAELARDLLPRTSELWNMYGPTETTVWSTCDRLTTPDDPITIGHPIPNTPVYIRNTGGQLMPRGLPGELCIGGAGVTLGYLDRPELTAERFVPDAYGDGSTSTLYRTGDLARFREDGRLEYLGRMDHQVKVRGFRVELGEIETHLCGHARITQAVVADRPGADGDSRLVAYLVAGGGAAIAADELRRYLGEVLPGYMVPSAYVFLDRMPLTPNGKIDRQALPDPNAARPELEERFAPPQTPMERILADVWCEALDIEQVGLNDNFFDLGGHSLNATRIMQTLGDALHTEIPLRKLFETPTIAGLSKAILNGADATCSDPRGTLTSIQPNGARHPLFFVAGAHAREDEFMRFLSNLIPHLGLDQPVYGFMARGLDGCTPPHRTVEEMAADYVADMRAFQRQGPYCIAAECVGGVVAYEMARQLNAEGAAVALLALMDCLRPRLHYIPIYRAYHLGRRIRNKLRTLAGRNGTGSDLPAHADASGTSASSSQRHAHDRRIRRVEFGYPLVTMRYRPKPYDGRLTLIVSRERHDRYGTLGWEALVPDLELHVVPGNHITRLTRHADVTGARLRECLDHALH